MKIAIFASGNGSNFQVLAEACKKGKIEGDIVLLFSDQEKAYALTRAAEIGIASAFFSPKSFSSKKEYEKELIELLKEYEVDLVVLAGYMRIIGEDLLHAYPKRIINIHPSYLPSFPGLHGIRDAFDAKVSETGVTVHYIDSGVDTGPIIAQEKVRIEETDTLESLEEKIHKVEHKLYPNVLARVVQELDNHREE